MTRDDREYSLSLIDSWTYLEAGEIEDLDPAFGQIGTRITICGTNLLGYGSDLREVRMNGLAANIVSTKINKLNHKEYDDFEVSVCNTKGVHFSQQIFMYTLHT